MTVSAVARCTSFGLCDTVEVLIEARNSSATPIDGCLATALTWAYEPSDSLRYALGIDTLEVAGARVCRWHPTSYRIDASVDTPFECRSVRLKTGQVFLDTLLVPTGARDFVDYPGRLRATVTIYGGLVGSTWGSAQVVALGSCPLTIPVPH